MLPSHIRSILYAHKRYLAGDQQAVCADMRGMSLKQMNFRDVSLRTANLARCDFEGADLRGANLSGANLSGANLHTVKIKGADLSGAILTRAFAAYVDFNMVNLTGTDISRADLSGAKLDGAIWGDTWETRLQAAKFIIVPEGDVIGWKKLRGGRIAKLLIPKEAKRSNGFNRRCRAEYVKVLSIVDSNGRICDSGTSKRDAMLKYEVGKITKADGWDEDWKNECSNGINFFVTYEEAEFY